MHLVNCDNPKYIFNKYTKEWVRVRCGVCDTCKVSKAADWVTRIDLENFLHKYCFMVTLTYDNEHLPAYFFDDSMDSVVLNRDESKCIPLSHFYDYIYNNKPEQIQKELDYLRSRLIHPLGLPVLYKKDISDFFKRLNKITHDRITETFENYRYFCCGEYGPTSYRPHYHLLVWFDDDEIARRFSEILLQAWPLGRSDASAVFSNGGRSYVAQYVNMSCHLPSFYQISGFRPSHQESKQPTIGCDVLLDSQIRDLYDRIPVKRNIYKPSSQRYVLLPVSNSIKNRFFPKFTGYHLFNDFERTRIFGVFQFLDNEKRDFQAFKDFASSFVLSEKRSSFGNDGRIVFSYIMYLYEQSERDIERFENCLRRWYFISKRVCYYASLLNVRLETLVSRIFEFWKKFDYECLISFYEFQESYAKQNPFTDLVCMYPDFYRMLKFYIDNPKERPFYIDVALNQFDIFDVQDIPDYKETFDYINMSEKNFSIYKDTHKRQFVNAYRDSKLFESDRTLAVILQNYQS